jgi:hypothetical protein
MQTGNPVDVNLEAGLKTLPTSAMRAARAEDRTQAGFTGALMRLAGVDSPVATPEVLSAAQSRFGQEFDEIYDQLGGLIDAKSDDGFLANTFAVERELRGTQNINADRLARDRQRLTNAMSGEVDAGLIQRTLAKLNEDGWRYARSDDPETQEYGNALLQLREHAVDALDTAAARSGNEGLRDDLADLNRRYARFSAIVETMASARGGQDKLNTGFIPPKAMEANARGFYRGRYALESDDPWMNLVRAGAQVIPNPTPNSGTAQRQYYRDLLTAKIITPSAAIATLGGGGAIAENPTLSLLAGGSAAAGLGLPWEVARRWYRGTPPQGLRPVVVARQPIAGLLTAKSPEEE